MIFEEYKVSVDIYPLDPVDGITSVVHIGKGGNSDDYGDQNPAIFIKHDAGSSSLLIRSSVNGDANYEVEFNALVIGQWTTVSIQQSKEHF